MLDGNKDVIALVAMGYVAKDKEEDDFFISLYPVSLIPTAVGDVTLDDQVTTSTASLMGENINVVTNKSNIIEAEWINQGDSNRISAPDVCMGEIVHVYNINGQDKYWWDTVFVKTSYRKREKALFFFSNKDKIDESPSMLEKGYFLLIDTYNKITQLHTANNDGEHTTYDLSIDGNKGSLIITDGKGNKIDLESKDDTLFINTNEKVHVTTKKAIISCDTSLVEATTSADIKTDTCTIKAKLCTIDSEQCNINP